MLPRQRVLQGCRARAAHTQRRGLRSGWPPPEPARAPVPSTAPVSSEARLEGYDGRSNAGTLARAVPEDAGGSSELEPGRQAGDRLSGPPKAEQMHFALELESTMRWFEPAAEEQLAAKAVVDKVEQVLKSSPLLKIACVQPVGSWARQTAVRQDFDVDMMVFVREYDGVDVTDLEVWRDDSLKYMRRHVKDLLQGADASWEVVIKNDAHYQHVLQVEVDGLEVDLLLAPDCAGGNAGRKWACMQHRRLTRPLLHAPAAASFDLVRHRADSAALNQFYIAASDEAKEVMRFVKGLYKSGIPSDQDHERIRSVSLEVLVLAAGQQLRSNRQCRKQRRGKVYKLQLFVEFLRLVVAAVKQRKVVMLDASYWCRAVRPYGYTREVGMQYDHIWGNDRVQIIHPTDFTCNLERAPEGRAPSDWSGLVRLAELLLCVLDSDSPSYFWLQPQVLHAMRAYGGDLKWMAWVEDVCLPTLRRLIRPKENKASRR